jgi:predicted RNA-binding Zn-ribbon protein involved in translation (DUF1610 family)
MNSEQKETTRPLRTLVPVSRGSGDRHAAALTSSSERHLLCWARDLAAALSPTQGALECDWGTVALRLLARPKERHDAGELTVQKTYYQLVSVMESLKTLKTTGRGRGVRGRWRNYCNNATNRGEIWRLLRYKCHLVGLRFQTCPPRGTSHTCPHCGKPAKTYRSPDQRSEDVKWGRWMWCEACGFNGDRDYCASLNIAHLGVAYLIQMKHMGKARSCSITDLRVKPVSYTGTGSALLLPPTSPHARPPRAGKMCYYPGWYGSAFLQSSQPKAVFLRLCG